MSTAQRGYYWGYLVPEVARLLMLDRDTADKVLNGRFLSGTLPIVDESVNVVRSLSDLNPQEASNYYSEIRMWIWVKFKVRLHEPERYDGKAKI